MKMTPEDLNNPQVMFPSPNRPAATFTEVKEPDPCNHGCWWNPEGPGYRFYDDCPVHGKKEPVRQTIDVGNRTAIDVLQNPPSLSEKTSVKQYVQGIDRFREDENPETAWVDDSGNPLPEIELDPEFAEALMKEEEDIRRHAEYTLLCERGGVEPMSYNEWVEFDKKYQEHVRTAPSPLSPATFQRLSEVESTDWKAKYDLAQATISDFIGEVKVICKQRDDAILRSAELESSVGSLQNTIKVLEEENCRLNEECEELYETTYEQDKQLIKIQSVPQNQKQFPHYFRQVPDTTHVDIYWVLKAWDVTDPCVQHAIKKLMAAGMRGAKNKTKDLQEARDSITRALELEQL